MLECIEQLPTYWQRTTRLISRRHIRRPDGDAGEGGAGGGVCDVRRYLLPSALEQVPMLERAAGAVVSRHLLRCDADAAKAQKRREDSPTQRRCYW
jgi:hypothetical protein